MLMRVLSVCILRGSGELIWLCFMIDGGVWLRFIVMVLVSGFFLLIG